MDTLKITLIISMGVYFLIMILTSLTSRRKEKQDEFIIANRNLGAIPIISSLSASFRDGTGIIAWTGFGFSIGYGGIWLMLGVLLAMFVYSGFGPRIRQSSIEHNAITVGELIRVAIGPITEKLSTGLVLIFSLVIISIQLYVAGSLFAEIIELDHWLGMVIVAIIVGSYLILGGYSAVVKTDVIQFFLILSVILIPSLALTDHQLIFEFSSIVSFPALDRLALFLMGFFFVMSSADVWQKIFAARNDAVIKTSFPVSGIMLIFMTVSLVWLGMTAKDLLTGHIESGQVLFELFNQGVLPTWMLGLLSIVVLAITMSSLDTYCYLFSSSLLKNFLFAKKTDNEENLKHYIKINRLVMLSVLLLSVLMAIVISDIIQTIFSAASLLFILSPIYIALGFGWFKHTPQLDRLLSFSIVISLVVYISLFVHGDFENMIMLVVPVVVNIVLMLVMHIYMRFRKYTFNFARD